MEITTNYPEDITVNSTFSFTGATASSCWVVFQPGGDYSNLITLRSNNGSILGEYVLTLSTLYNFILSSWELELENNTPNIITKFNLPNDVPFNDFLTEYMLGRKVRDQLITTYSKNAYDYSGVSPPIISPGYGTSGTVVASASGSLGVNAIESQPFSTNTPYSLPVAATFTGDVVTIPQQTLIQDSLTSTGSAVVAQDTITSESFSVNSPYTIPVSGTLSMNSLSLTSNQALYVDTFTIMQQETPLQTGSVSSPLVFTFPPIPSAYNGCKIYFSMEFLPQTPGTYFVQIQFSTGTSGALRAWTYVISAPTGAVYTNLSFPIYVQWKYNTQAENYNSNTVVGIVSTPNMGSPPPQVMNMILGYQTSPTTAITLTGTPTGTVNINTLTGALTSSPVTVTSPAVPLTIPLSVTGTPTGSVSKIADFTPSGTVSIPTLVGSLPSDVLTVTGPQGPVSIPVTATGTTTGVLKYSFPSYVAFQVVPQGTTSFTKLLSGNLKLNFLRSGL